MREVWHRRVANDITSNRLLRNTDRRRGTAGGAIYVEGPRFANCLKSCTVGREQLIQTADDPRRAEA